MKITGLTLPRPLKAPSESGVSEIAPLVKPVFLADLHLSGRNKKTLLSFLWFLRTKAKLYEELFILGDIFEYWIGDDACSPVEPIARALRKYASLSKKIYFMQGNRDFMLGEAFSEHCGAVLLRENTVVNCGQTRILLAHGDAWCTLDEQYQNFRAQMHDAQFQIRALEMTVAERIDFAKKARAESVKTKTVKTREMMDVVESAVAQTVRETGASHVIHGHIHRPAQFKCEGYTRTVVPDWDLDNKVRPHRGWVEINSAGVPQLVLTERFC